MSIKVTDVSFSIAKEVKSGSCGFCRVILNNCVAVNRIRVFKSVEGEYKVLLPRLDNTNAPKPIVQFLNEETIKEVTDAVINKYNVLIKDYNGLYKQNKFKNKIHVKG